MKRVNFVAALALTLAGAAVSVSGAVYAAEKPPQISADLAKPLKAAQDAMKAKKFDEAITHLKEAQAEKGEREALGQCVPEENAGIPAIAEAAQA